MSWLLAFGGFAALIILHELGHFAAAKATGMRVERFSLFFPPRLFGIKRGETDYAVGVIPLGGYVKITGMVRGEEFDPQHEHRAYYNQPIWKRVVVISAGPLMNVLVAFLLLLAFFVAVGPAHTVPVVGERDTNIEASALLRSGDHIVTLDGAPGGYAELVNSGECAGPREPGCDATATVPLLLVRDGKLIVTEARPQFDPVADRMRLGFRYAVVRETEPLGASLNDAVDRMWRLTKETLMLPARIVDSERRKEISGTVGAYEATRQTIKLDAEDALFLLALISLSLAIVNLFPFLPLDGGHIFWALAEGVRGRPIPTVVIERASAIGFALVIGLFLIGFTNDIDRLRSGGFGP